MKKKKIKEEEKNREEFREQEKKWNLEDDSEHIYNCKQHEYWMFFFVDS